MKLAVGNDGICDNHIRRHCCICKSLGAAHVMYAHEHNIRLGYHGTEYVAVQAVAHVLTILVMSDRLHVRRQYSHAIASP